MAQAGSIAMVISALSQVIEIDGPGHEKSSK